jgi:hypothetical protein
MIIHDLYVIGITIDPFKAYPPLIVDPNAVLPCPVAAELLQPVGWWNAEIVQCEGIILERYRLAFMSLPTVEWGPTLSAEDPLGDSWAISLISLY